MVKVTNFIIGVLVSSLVITILAVFMGSLNTHYAPVDYNSTRLAVYNELQNLTEITENIKDEALSIEQDSGILDVIGGYFSSGYQALTLTARSLDVFGDMFSQSIDDLNLGTTGTLLKTTFMAIIIILLIIGVLVSAIVKRDL